MSSNKTNDSFQKVENENSKKIKYEYDEELLIKCINEIKNEETRSQAIGYLYKYREENENIAIYLWYSRGTMATLLQEITKIYQFITSSKLTTENSDKAKHIISLFQIIALNPITRKDFLESQILVFLYPFLSNTNKTKSYEIEILRVTSLSVIAALVKQKNYSDVINFLIKTEIIPVILRIMEKGTEIIRAVSCFIIQRIIENSNGLKYICDLRERLFAIICVLNAMLQNKLSDRLIKNVLQIYLGLIGNKDAKNLIRQRIPKKLKDKKFIQSLDNSSRAKVDNLLKSLEEDETERDIKIIKLKNDLTYKNNSNIIQNINIINNNTINIYNNPNQMNLNNNDMSNTTQNINMMFMNNLNQMKMQPGFMLNQPVGDFNYNVYNDNENFTSSNIYNQNTNTGFPNINFYKTYNNI